MALIRLETCIAAPVATCFDLARDIDFHLRSFRHTGERAVAGKTSGLIGLSESVTWEAKHLGVRQRLTSQITAFDPPRYFRDEMTQGAFRAFVHDHHFEEQAGGTRMIDEIVFRSPLGPVGAIFDRVFLQGYLRRLIAVRCEALKQEAEKESWGRHTCPPEV